MATKFEAIRGRDREIVRETAELLSSGVSLSELFERFCTLLARYVDASVVFIAVDSADGAHIEFALDHGVSRRDAHLRVNPRSQTQRVLDTGSSVLMKTREDLKGPLVPFRTASAQPDDSVSAVFVPLRFAGRTIGVLSVQSPVPSAYDESDVHLLETCALYAAVAINADEMRSTKEAFEEAATSDSLTGLANRRVFDQRILAEWRHAVRDGTTLSLAFLDIDWFKAFNDTYGHVAGDACLEQVAAAASSCLTRKTDVVARYGGEEFAAILCATESTGALAIAERIRAAIEALDIPHLGSPLGHVTASVGVASCRPSGDMPEVLVRAADRALYAAKSAGRNRIVGEQISPTIVYGRKTSALSNLRPNNSPLFGREEELCALIEALKARNLITITGPPGVGKTRLACAVAQRQLYAFFDGVWMVEFAGARDGALVDVVVANALGISEQPGVSLRQVIVDDLRTKNRLLIFDNCEHLTSVIAPLCETLLGVAPELRIIATSREPVRTPHEMVIPLQPLPGDQARAMFQDRARAVVPDWQPGEEEATLDALCAHLDNLPLAIELVAPRAKTMSLRQMSEALSDRFHLVAGSERHADPRQQTLYSTLAWSFDQLDERGQRLLGNLTVFPGVFLADAARDICADDVVEPWDLLGTLSMLIEKSLVVAEKTELREELRLLESTRDFARLRLSQRGVAQTQVARRHIGYYRALAQRASQLIESGHIEQSLAMVQFEWDNFQGALQRALVDNLDAASGRAIVRAFSHYFVETGRSIEGNYWIERALQSQGIESDERAELLYAAALIAHSQGNFRQLEKLGRQLLELYQERHDPAGMAKALNALGNAMFHLNQGSAARAFYEKALTNYRIAEDRRGVAVAQMNLGSLCADVEGNTKNAVQFFEESLSTFRELGISVNIGTAIANLGEVSAYDGDYHQALIYANQSLEIFERLHNESMAAWQLINIAALRLALGEHGLCDGALRAAYEKLSRERHPEYWARYLEIRAGLFTALQYHDEAAQLYGYVERFRSAHNAPRLPMQQKIHDQAVLALREALGQERFIENWSLGGELRNTDAQQVLNRAPVLVVPPGPWSAAP